MRPIKFRAYYIQEKEIYPVRSIDFTDEIVLIDLGGVFMELKFHEVELMQFTGMTDKDGVEIYEGDVVKVNKSIFANYPFSLSEHFAVELRYYGWWPFSSSGFPGSHNIEIIGNIYQNTELLEMSK